MKTDKCSNEKGKSPYSLININSYNSGNHTSRIMQTFSSEYPKPSSQDLLMRQKINWQTEDRASSTRKHVLLHVHLCGNSRLKSMSKQMAHLNHKNFIKFLH